MKVLLWISEQVNRVFEIIGSILVIVLVLIIGAQVAARYIFNAPLYWSEELGRIIFVWLIFLGASIGVKRGSHMGLHFIAEMASEKTKRFFNITSLIFSAVFFLFVLIAGFEVTIKISSQLTPAMQISSSWQYAAIPVGAFIALLHFPSLIIEKSLITKSVQEVKKNDMGTFM